MIISKEQIVGTYRTANPQSNVPLALFRSRIKSRLARNGKVIESEVLDALYLTKPEYRKKYASRKTYVMVDQESIELNKLYQELSNPNVSYSTFRQRVKKLEGQALIDVSTIKQASNLANDEWITYFGGGRRREFVYLGSEYPNKYGKTFSSVTSFLRDIGKYEERATIWARRKRRWDLDDAIIEPVQAHDERSGIIYLISCSESKNKYVGLTIMTPDQRWRRHVQTARENHSQAPLHAAIRKWGEDSFKITTLEAGLTQEELPDRERHWIKELDTHYPAGFNARPGGEMGGGKGKEVEYEGETFSSRESAASILSDRTGIAIHVVLRRLSRGERIPINARSMSKHPEAGTNLWRRWKSLLNGVASGRRKGEVCEAWESYDNFAADVRLGYQPSLMLVRIDNSKPWEPDNVKWVTKQEAVSTIHGTTFLVHGQPYPSLNAIARAYGIGRTTLKNRLDVQGLSIEEAVDKPLGPTSKPQQIKSNSSKQKKLSTD